jgi:hypothetical protein
MRPHGGPIPERNRDKRWRPRLARVPAARRLLPGGPDHLALPRDDRRENLLLLALRHFEVVERAADLRSDLVELGGGDLQILVGLAR